MSKTTKNQIARRFAQSCREWQRKDVHNWIGRQSAYADLYAKHGRLILRHVQRIKLILDTLEFNAREYMK